MGVTGGRRDASVRPPTKALENLAGELVISLMALAVLLVLVMALSLSPLGIGLLLLPRSLRAVRSLAEHQRSRTAAGKPEGATVPSSPWDCLALLGRDAELRRELQWLLWQALAGLALSCTALLLPVAALRDVSYPLWWRLVPHDLAFSSIGIRADDWTRAIAVSLLGMAMLALSVVLVPRIDQLMRWVSRALLLPSDQERLHERIVELQETRSGALQAHTDELRRIERALHDGAQSRLVATTIKIGSARRALTRNPERAAAALEEAQLAAEAALAELRAVVRGMHPPALDNHDLTSAVEALAAGCAVPCTVESSTLGDLPQQVEATVYHVAAEAITNISRHSGASRARITLSRDAQAVRMSVADDGHGGADERAGSGLAGLRRRVAAHDGRLVLSSPPGGPTRLEVELPCTS